MVVVAVDLPLPMVPLLGASQKTGPRFGADLSSLAMVSGPCMQGPQVMDLTLMVMFGPRMPPLATSLVDFQVLRI